ncbi:MAG: methyltransferase domain-containing protein [Methanomassiliicoccales archaeon]|nr:methyltransferase domain-containing protein [Methanomassiliicoccales archaeon]
MSKAPSQFPAAEKHRLVDESRRKRQPVEVIVERMRLFPGEVVADLGAGIGYLSIPMADAGAEVIALDFQQEMLDSLRERDGGSDRITLVKAELPLIPLPDASLDRVVMLNVFHEVEDKGKLSQEILRVLRPKGRLTIVDWQARQTEHGPPMHERVPMGHTPSFFQFMELEKGYDDENYYHLELRRE